MRNTMPGLRCRRWTSWPISGTASIDDAADLPRALARQKPPHLANATSFKNLTPISTSMYSSQYLQFSDTVPFLAIVLNGCPFERAAILPHARDELLRLIDYGVYPSFT